MAQQAFYTKINASAGVQFSGGTIAQATAVLHTNNVLYLRGGSAGLSLQNADGSDRVEVLNDNVRIETNSTERLRVTSAGLVGINTSNPLTKLQITAANASSPTANIFLDIDGSNTPGMGGQIIFGSSTSGTLTDYIARIQGVRSALDNGSSDLHFQTTHVSTATGPTTKMTILSGGNVGIGTVSPGNKLHVNGGEIQVVNGTSGKLLLQNSNNYVYGDQNGVGIFNANDNLRLYTVGIIYNLPV